MTRVLACCLVIVLVAPDVRAQEPQPSIARAAARAVSDLSQNERQPSAETRGRIPRGLLWTGIGLLAAGGLYFGIAAAAGDDNACVSIGRNEDCLSVRTVGLTMGSILAGTGGALLAIGISKSHRAPSITVAPGRVLVRHTIPVHSHRSDARVR